MSRNAPKFAPEPTGERLPIGWACSLLRKPCVNRAAHLAAALRATWANEVS